MLEGSVSEKYKNYLLPSGLLSCRWNGGILYLGLTQNSLIFYFYFKLSLLLLLFKINIFIKIIVDSEQEVKMSVRNLLLIINNK